MSCDPSCEPHVDLCTEPSPRREFHTDRLSLRPWRDSDAEHLFELAKDPDIGPIAGWPPHQSVEESREVIHGALGGPEIYAVVLTETRQLIGSVGLHLAGTTDMTEREDECELGYWIGKPFWGRGYAPEAAAELIRHAFEDLGMTTIWAGYYDGNDKSKRVQEKLGFVYDHSCDTVGVPLLGEIRTGHTNRLTKERWTELEAPNV